MAPPRNNGISRGPFMIVRRAIGWLASPATILHTTKR
jgi:hypothetical protein